MLRHYIAKHMRLTYQRHKLGLTIFSMEGFEYKSYKSKHGIQSRNNERGVQAKQSLNMLKLLYSRAEFNVEKELKSGIKTQISNIFNLLIPLRRITLRWIVG